MRSNEPRRRSRGGLQLITIALCALALGACGGSDDDSTTDSTGVERVDQGDIGEPVEGGSVVYALGSETSGWDPTAGQWAPWGLIEAKSFFDTLTVFDEDGNIHPYLAESFTPNDTYTTWEIKLRSGVKFHNGEDLTADVLQRNWQFFTDSPLTGRIFDQIADTRVSADDPLVMEVDTTAPWVNFPNAWTTQIGVVMAPEMLDNPDRGIAPIGTGPFEFITWENGDFLEVQKFDDYWQEGLPYLDKITFEIATDPTSRANGLRDGSYNLAYLEEPNLLLDFADDPEFNIWQDPTAETGESFVMLNTKQAPLDDDRVRRALALSTDLEEYNTVVNDGQRTIASGPYRENSPWYAETDYPTYDLAAAQALVEEYEAENGPIEFEIALGAGGTAGTETVSLLIEQWRAAGIDVMPDSREVASMIINVVSGNYDAVLWRQFDSPHPLQESVWWGPQTSGGIDEVALNFARNENQTIGDAVDDARMVETVEEERELYAEVQRQLAQDIPYIWLSHIDPTIVAKANIAGIDEYEIPGPDGQPLTGDDGEPLRAMPFHNSAHALQQVWVIPEERLE